MDTCRAGVSGEGRAAGGYRYVRLRGRYVCVDRSPLRPLLRGDARAVRHLGVRTSLSLLLHRWAGRATDGGRPTLKLPVPGQSCRAVQRGYLVFDVERGVVVQVFQPRIPDALFQTFVRIGERIDGLAFAAKVLASDAEEQWLEMEFVDGEPGETLIASRPDTLSERYMRLIRPCLDELTRQEPPRRRRVEDYVETLRTRLRLEVLAEYPAVARLALEHVEEIVAALALRTGGEILVAFSHGDFVHPNFVVTPQGLRVIDWDSAGRRSALHDMHAFFFSQMYWNDAFFVSESMLRLSARSLLGASAQEPDTDTLYRHLYYLERVAMILARNFSPADAEHLRRTIELHRAYEHWTGREHRRAS